MNCSGSITLALLIGIIATPIWAAGNDRCTGKVRPDIAAWTHTVSPDDSLFLTGDRFSADQDVIFKNLGKGSAPRRWRTPVRWTDGRHLLATMPDGAPRGVYKVKVDGGQGCQSKSVLIDAPQLWWHYPKTPEAGQGVRLFGRNLAYPVDSAHPAVYVYPADGGKGRWLQAAVQGRYALTVNLPKDLRSGRWSIRVAVTRGQRAAWSAPITLDIKRSTERHDQSVHVGNAKALYRALSKLKAQGQRGTIHLAAGTYALDKPLYVPTGVRLVGEGTKKTTLQFVGRMPELKGLAGAVYHGSYRKMAYAHDLQPGKRGARARAAVLLFGSGSGVSHLAIIGNRSVQIGIAIAGTRSEPVRREVLAHLHIVDLGPVRKRPGQSVAILARHVRSLEVRDNSIRSSGPAVFLEDVADSAIENNQLSGMGTGVISAREGGIRRCVIQGNHFVVGKDGVAGIRALWISTLFGSSYENYIAHNQGAHFRPPPGTDQNRGEAILMETALSHPYFGHPAAAAGNSVTLPKKGVNWRLLASETDDRHTPLNEYFVVIVSGPGQGEARRIVGRNRRTLTLDRSWRMKPTPRSVIVITELFYRNLVIGNKIRDAKTGVQFWINGIDNVIADNQLTNIRGGGVVLYSNALGRAPGYRRVVWPFGTHNMSGFNAGIGMSYFNEVRGNVVKNASCGICVYAGDFRTHTGPVDWPLSMGNAVSDNRVSDTHRWGIYTGTFKSRDKDDKVPGFSVMGNLIEGNFVSDARFAYGTDGRSQSIVFRRNTANFGPLSHGKRAGLVLPPKRKGLVGFHEQNIFEGLEGETGHGIPDVIRKSLRHVRHRISRKHGQL